VEEAVPVVSGYASCVALAHCAGDLLSNTVHLPFCGTYAPAHLNNSLAKDMLPQKTAQQVAASLATVQEVPANVLTEFEHELEEDLASVAVTLTAVTGVIIFWRGVWSLLDCESAAAVWWCAVSRVLQQRA
jgi:hypothetical protein